MKTKRVFSSAAWSMVLFCAVVFTVFGVAMFPVEWHTMLYKGWFTLIYFAAVFCLDKNRTIIIVFTVISIVVNWISGFYGIIFLQVASLILNIILFIYFVVELIRQVALAKTVTMKVILESINGYLLIGIVFAILVSISGQVDPAGFSFQKSDGDAILLTSNFSTDLYFTFITLATVGYGYMLPLKPFTRALSTLIGISGQLYIAIIIAMLVGKFASQQAQK